MDVSEFPGAYMDKDIMSQPVTLQACIIYMAFLVSSVAKLVT